MGLKSEYEETKMNELPTKELIQTIINQQNQISKLQELNKKLSTENAELLKLSENEKKRKSENENLRNEKNKIEWQLKQSKANEADLKKQIEGMGDKYNSMFAKFPKSEEVEKLTHTYKQASQAISLVSISSWFNNFFVLLFAAIVLFTGCQVYFAKDYAREANDAIHNAIQKIEGGLYNTDGYSVIKGSKSSKEVFDATHPQQKK